MMAIGGECVRRRGGAVRVYGDTVHGVHVDAVTSWLVDRASCVIIHGPVLVIWGLFGNSGVGKRRGCVDVRVSGECV